MTPGGEVVFTHYRGPDVIEVKAAISDYHPAWYGDPGHPAEGGEVEILEVTTTDGQDIPIKDIPSDLYDDLCTHAIEEHGA